MRYPLKTIIHRFSKTSGTHLQFHSTYEESEVWYWILEHPSQQGSAWAHVLSRQFAILSFERFTGLRMLLSDLPDSVNLLVHCRNSESTDELYLGRGNDPVFSTIPNTSTSGTVILLPLSDLRYALKNILSGNSIRAMEHLFSHGTVMVPSNPKLSEELTELHRFRGQGGISNFDYYGRIIHLLFRILEQEKATSHPSKNRTLFDEEHLFAVECYIRQHFNESIRLEELSKIACMSPTKLKYSFKNHYGMTIISYQQNLRVEHAKRLLVTTNQTVQEISHKVGYRNPSSLSNVFRSATGMTPVEYRNNVSSTVPEKNQHP